MPAGTGWDTVGHPDCRNWLTSQRFLRSERWDMVGHGGTFQPGGTSGGVQGKFRGSSEVLASTVPTQTAQTAYN